MMPKQKDCDRAIAALLSCTKRRTRPLSLVEIEQNLHVATVCLGSIDAVSERIGVSRSMLKRFEAVKRLHPALLSLAKQRVIDSVDSAAELSSLSHDTQRAFADVLPAAGLDTEDIRACVRLLSRTPDMRIQDVIVRVKSSKSVRVYVYEFVVRASMRPNGIIASNVKAVLPAEQIAGIEIHGSTGKLKVFKPAKQILSTEARKRRLSVASFVQRLCEGII